MNLSNNEVKILKFLNSTPQGTNSGIDISFMLGHFNTTIQSISVSLSPLVNEGYINVTNSNRYVLTLVGANYLERQHSENQKTLKNRIIWSIGAPIVVSLTVSLITAFLIN